MKPPQTVVLVMLLSLTTFTASLTPPPHISPTPSLTSTLDPKQLKALHSLSLPTYNNPCSQPSLHNATLCDSSSPFRHLISLRLTNCYDDVSLSKSALKSLSSLQDLQFINCPIAPIPFPENLANSLRSFTCVNSLRKLTGLWLAQFHNVTVLRVTNVTVKAQGPFVVLSAMTKLKSLTISQANLNGYVPKHWHSNVSYIDLSGNKLQGKIHDSITLLEDLRVLDLSSNQLSGEIPISIGDLFSLENVSLASNLLSGAIPESMAAIKTLVHVDLSSNRLNGTIPHFISKLDNLKYLNLANNEFHGVMPFNESFIKKLVVFKVGGNSNLCYNHSTLSTKLKLGIAPCDKHGLPMSPPPAKESPGDGDSDESNDDYADSTSGDSNHKDDHHHGPSKIVLGVAIGLSSIVFLIIFLILLSKWCH